MVNVFFFLLHCDRSGFKTDARNGASENTQRKVLGDQHTMHTRKPAAASPSHPKNLSDARNRDWRRSDGSRKSGCDAWRSVARRRRTSWRVAKSRRSLTLAVCRPVTAASLYVTIATPSCRVVVTSTNRGWTATVNILRQTIRLRWRKSATTSTTKIAWDVATAHRLQRTARRHHTRRSASGASCRLQHGRGQVPAMTSPSRCVVHGPRSTLPGTITRRGTILAPDNCWCKLLSRSHLASR